MTFLRATTLPGLLAATALLCLPARAGWFDEEPLRTVQDLRYGAALYEFYQDKNLEALSELMVAEARGGIEGHGDNPEIMAGGFYLAYGMQGVARDIFERLLDHNRPARTRNAAWFYLARMHYLKGEYQQAERTLAELSEVDNPRLAQDVKVLKFKLDIAGGRTAHAATYLEDKTLMRSDWAPYLRFNLAAAHAREGRWQQAAEGFATLTTMRERSDEHLALYDKAMTGEGYAYLFAGQYPEAQRGFTKVRLDSPHSNRALLGYGWAAFEQDDYSQALKPWQALTRRSLIDENVQEAWVAIATVYESMGFSAEAMAQYRQAEQAYQQEITRLDDAVANMEGSALRQALNIDRSADFDWLDYAANNRISPELVYLVDLFAKDAFLRRVQELRDLIAIQNNLQQWQRKLVLYTQMLDERQANRSRDTEFVKQQELGLKYSRLRARRNELATTLDALSDGEDALELIAPHERKQLDRINNIERNLLILQSAARRGQTVMPEQELRELTEQWRIQKGLLRWKVAEWHDARVGKARRELAAVDDALVQQQKLLLNIEEILTDSFDLAPYRDQIGSAEDRLTRQLAAVDLAINRAEHNLRNQVREALIYERDRLTHYLAQARLSVARLQDSATEYSGPPTQEPAGNKSE